MQLQHIFSSENYCSLVSHSLMVLPVPFVIHVSLYLWNYSQSPRTPRHLNLSRSTDTTSASPPHLLPSRHRSSPCTRAAAGAC